MKKFCPVEQFDKKDEGRIQYDDEEEGFELALNGLNAVRNRAQSVFLLNL